MLPVIDDRQDLARNAMISGDRAAALIGDAASDPEVDAVAECRIPADATRIHDGHLRRAAAILGVDPIISSYPAAALVGDAATRDEINPSADGGSGDWVPRDAAGIYYRPGATDDVDAITGTGDASAGLVGDSAASTQGYAGAQDEGIIMGRDRAGKRSRNGARVVHRGGAARSNKAAVATDRSACLVD